MSDRYDSSDAALERDLSDEVERELEREEETEHIGAIRAWGIAFLEALKARDANG